MNWYLHACGLKTDTSIACWKYDGTVMDTPSSKRRGTTTRIC